MTWKYVCLLAAVVAVFVWVQSSRVPVGPYIYDEADYLLAASHGPWANAWDAPSRPFVDFVYIGISALQGKASRSSLSQVSREGTDINFLRHTHGPFYYYFLWGVWRAGGDEGAVRSWALLFPLLTGLMIGAGCVWVLPSGVGMRAGLCSAALFCWSPAVVTTREIAPHLAFSLCVLASLFCAAKTISSGERKYWYAAWVAAGLAFTALEVAFVLVITLGAVGWTERKRLALDRETLLRTGAALLITALAVWPAGILKLSAVKSYLFMAYLAVARTAAWGEVTFAGTWMHRFEKSPVEWLMLGSAVALWFLLPKLRMRQLVPFLVFGALMMLTMLRVNTLSLRYLLPAVPALHVFAGSMLAGCAVEMLQRETGRRIATAALILALGWNLQRFVKQDPLRIDNTTPEILQSVRDQDLEDKRLLVTQDFMPTVHYYFPRAEVRGFLEISPELLAGHDAVLYAGQSRFAKLR